MEFKYCKDDGKTINGKAIGDVVLQEIKNDILDFSKKLNCRSPKLSVILVGDRVDSATYVKMKEKACATCGIISEKVILDASVSETEILKKLDSFNNDHSVDGILVQLPLPKHIDERRVLCSINVDKDVDGLHPHNVGTLALKNFSPLFTPCTAEGVMVILKKVGVPIAGQHAVVVGRSNIIGMPVALLLQQENATVSVVHSYTKNIADYTRRADILVVAIGKPNFITRDMIKEGAVVIDVGINSVPDDSKKSGYRLVGDVSFDDCYEKASLITPVPCGVGPLTVAMLIHNTYNSWLRRMNPEL